MCASFVLPRSVTWLFLSAMNIGNSQNDCKTKPNDSFITVLVCGYVGKQESGGVYW